ncbi:hypothetical protein BJY04DRAFT_202598 [Aspergillus karnatakaensis]|uniref:uncharacterized protein n=1 Tax=Aspergillus karnatakaensis TaxID=1810916 RepID=UPI003CCD65F3
MFACYIGREFILCLIYLVQALKQIHSIVRAKGSVGRKVMIQLIIVQAIIMGLDTLSLLVIFIGRTSFRMSSLVETSYIALQYALKMKMEFVILNRLMVLLQSPVVGWGSSLDPGGLLDESMATYIETPTTPQADAGRPVLVVGPIRSSAPSNDLMFP